jgi:hypothetical protein
MLPCASSPKYSRRLRGRRHTTCSQLHPAPPAPEEMRLRVEPAAPTLPTADPPLRVAIHQLFHVPWYHPYPVPLPRRRVHFASLPSATCDATFRNSSSARGRHRRCAQCTAHTTLKPLAAAKTIHPNKSHSPSPCAYVRHTTMGPAPTRRSATSLLPRLRTCSRTLGVHPRPCIAPARPLSSTTRSTGTLSTPMQARSPSTVSSASAVKARCGRAPTPTRSVN